MNFSKIIFQKDLYELTRQDLETFFTTEQEENAILEFKEGSTDIVKIHKEVAAFLNTEGGLLILGAPREKEHLTKKGYKVASGPLTPSSVRDRDVIMRSLGTNISPAPAGIRIHPIEIDNGAVYILEIQQSVSPPHQVSASGSYYLRMEREAKAAPHGIVEALFFKRQKPNLNVKFTAASSLRDPQLWIATFEVINESMFTAESLGVIFNIWGVKSVHSVTNLDNSEVENEHFRTEHRDTGGIFVKGLSRKYEVTYRPIYSHAYVDFTYYCKDLQSEHINVLLTPLQNSEIYDSKNNSKESEIMELNYRRFIESKKRDWENLLNPKGEVIFNEPITLAQREKLENHIGSNYTFPPSYRDFLSIANGFNGMIGANLITLYNFERLHTELKHINRNTIFNITDNMHGIEIGTYNTMGIAMLKTEKGKDVFGLISYSEYSGNFHSKTNNLYELILLASKNAI